ncbi:MAG TPA: peptidylprolyl isomerase [Anaerolineales bacterium]|nr:peptidylprolyl isomerase [Anaerolineales bacterium]
MENKKKKPKNPTKKHVARLERERQQVRLVRTVAYVMFGVIALLLVYGYIDTTYIRLQKPVAEVNGEEITIQQWQERVQLQRVRMFELYNQYNQFQQQFGMDFSQQIQNVQSYLESPQSIGQLTLNQMIDEALIRQEAEARGITVSDEEVEQAVQEWYRFFPDGTPVPTATATPFEYPKPSSQQLTLYPATATPTKFLTSTPAPTNTPDPSIPPTATMTAAPPTPTFVPEDVTPTPTAYTFDSFNTEYQTTLDIYKDYGISEAIFREDFRNDLLRKKVLEAISADTSTSGEQIWARHILVDNASLAGTVRLLLTAGGDFTKAAREYSIDTGSGAVGGDLGWFSSDAMVPEFGEAASTQEIGEIGEPVQSQFGYHIIQVLDRQVLPLTATQIEQNREIAFSEWLTTRKDESEIITYDETWLQNLPPFPNFGLQ